jgi:methylphosphotriester-DNA--protein-cysteine methyltransferase
MNAGPLFNLTEIVRQPYADVGRLLFQFRGDLPKLRGGPSGRSRLSPYHFARAFKQSFGVPPHRYHIERRIARAKELLSGSSVTEVAMAVGFAETSSFSTAFRRATGFTPSEFRRGKT